MTETINGLHSCKPGNEPQQGETKTFVVEHRPAKDGKKAWIKIKAAGADYGGSPYRILNAEPTGFTDAHGNISFNIEIEPATQQGETSVNEPQAPSERPRVEDGVDDARKHLMQSCNLYTLCIDAVEKTIEPHFSRKITDELYQAAVATLYIQAARSGMVDKMPKHPIHE